MIDLTDEERKFLGFRLAIHLEDSEKLLKKREKQGFNILAAREQIQRLEQLTYTKIIPESWHEPKPSYWK